MESGCSCSNRGIYFAPRCPSSRCCINEYLAIYSGVQKISRSIFSVADYFPTKSSFCWKDKLWKGVDYKVCQGVECKICQGWSVKSGWGWSVMSDRG